MNGGTCMASSNGFLCYCPLGFGGETCAEGNRVNVESQLCSGREVYSSNTQTSVWDLHIQGSVEHIVVKLVMALQ